ncbi:MAG: leucyl/phenylalanyl-tRNA--protein transferase [Flavobacteriaceae bacterium]|nr:leucyl/phenylalanyl-tRNA--protein transferase [Flavobacteriaceae bacterium]
MFLLNESLVFPDPSEAGEEGLLAVGGDLSSDRLLLAYQSGIFPWYDDLQPILWWSPDPRMVLFPSKFKVSKSLSKTIKSKKFSITFNTNFSEVIKNCSTIKRGGQAGTWITQEMNEAYIQLHHLGHAQSVEVWQQDELVGGLYGINLPKQKIFCGESMFSTQTDASKVGFYYLVRHLQQKEYNLIDCQMHTDHLESLGAEEITRLKFLQYLNS